ncbi:MAG: hypothetical protein JWL77_5152 [Chthonomonadaceae bacterium]|nr:hypothetical protein [Chthonomonadaceae bacterium]
MQMQMQNRKAGRKEGRRKCKEQIGKCTMGTPISELSVVLDWRHRQQGLFLLLLSSWFPFFPPSCSEFVFPGLLLEVFRW